MRDHLANYDISILVHWFLSNCGPEGRLFTGHVQSTPLNLAGQCLVVIGGTTGLGLSAAQAFLSAGASGVVVSGRSPESAAAAIASLGDRAAAHTGDATSPTHASEAIALCVSRFGRCDGLYHVAGGSGRRFGDGPLHEITDEGVRTTLDLNLVSLIYSNRAAVRHFLAQKSPGAIVNMGSVLGSSPSRDYFATHAYAATKSAVIGFTKAAAAYYAAHNIRFNVIAPALVDTPMAKRAAADEEILAFIKTKQPLDGGRIGRPDDCDGAAVFLFSDSARFITGQVLAVDGGWALSNGQLPHPS